MYFRHLCSCFTKNESYSHCIDESRTNDGREPHARGLESWG